MRRSHVDIGFVFRWLTVISHEGTKPNPVTCLCVCGNTVEMATARLLAGERSSCGCRRTKISEAGRRNMAAVKRGALNPLWKGDKATPAAGRARARRMLSLGPCEDCEKPATDRHHKDGNTNNNDRANLAILCRRCHMVADGRMNPFVSSEEQIKRAHIGHEARSARSTPRNKAILRGILDGLTDKEIATEVGLTVDRIWQLRKELKRPA